MSSDPTLTNTSIALLYESLSDLSLLDEASTQWSESRIAKELEPIIQSHIALYVTESESMLKFAQPNFFPLTFTLWRKIALKQVFENLGTSPRLLGSFA